MAGVKGKSGRKARVDEQELARLLQRGWPNKDRITAIKKLAEKANNGDVDAFKTLAAYTFGKPVQRSEIAGPNGGAVSISIIEAVKPS